MSSPVKLVTPYPTIEEAAELYGISTSRLGRLKKMLNTLVRENKAVQGSRSGTKHSAHEAITAQSARLPRKSSKNGHAKQRSAKTK